MHCLSSLLLKRFFPLLFSQHLEFASPADQALNNQDSLPLQYRGIIISVSLKADFSDYLVTSRSISVYIMIPRNNKKPVRRCSNGYTEIYQEPCRLVRKMIRLGICRPNIPCAENIITSNSIFLKILRQFFSHRICTHVIIIKMQIRYM